MVSIIQFRQVVFCVYLVKVFPDKTRQAVCNFSMKMHEIISVGLVAIHI